MSQVESSCSLEACILVKGQIIKKQANKQVNVDNERKMRLGDNERQAPFHGVGS